MRMLSQNKSTVKQAAIRILSRRSYSEREIWQRLKAQGFLEDSINEVISYLKERGYLDDTALCTMLIDKLTSSLNYSLKGIVIKAKQRGIPDLIISDCIKNYEKSFEFEAALKLAEKRYKNYDSTQQIKVGRYLTYKGFSSNTIMKVIEKLNLQ